MRTMSPLTMAREECANYYEGGCIGVYPEYLVDTDGPWHKRTKPPSPKVSKPMEHCLLKEKKHCRYFEGVVIPGIENMSKPPAARSCECGNFLKPRYRFCSECRAKRRKESYRTAQSKKRHTCQQLTSFSGS